ncbi:hypothetical protein BH09VER1_BH09VER1_00250 [soil metagenome]
MPRPLRIAFITTDLRDDHRRYNEPEPSFGAAPTAVVEGFALLNSAEAQTDPRLVSSPFPFEIHVISCVQRTVNSPTLIGPHIFYHSIVIGKWGWLRGGYLGCIDAVRKKLQEISPDIVHGQGTERYCSLSAIFSGYPNVMTIHGNMRAVAKNHLARPMSFDWLAARLESLTLPRSGGVFCNSAYTESLVRPLAKRVWRVPNALRAAFWEPLPPPAKEASTLIVNVGVICAHKRQLELLEFAEQLHEIEKTVRWLFIGNASKTSLYSANFLRKIKPLEKAGLASHIQSLTPSELTKVFDTAGAMLHFPSEEAFGLVVAEALARNLKFFGAKAGGVIDIAQGVERAELVAPNDWDALSQAIASWVQQGAPKPKNSAAQMFDLYHPTVVARRHLEIYAEMVGTPK